MDWQPILTALAIGAGAMVAAASLGLKELVAAWFKKVTKKVARATYVKQIEKVANFLEILDQCKEIREVDRILLYHGHNCGGLPSPGKSYTTRAIHGWSKDGKDPLKKYGFDNQVDLHYVKMLEDMIKAGVSTQVFDQMPKDAKLRSYFASEGTRYARLYFLGVLDYEMIYICFASYTDPFSDADVENMMVYVDQLRSLLEFE